MTYHVIIAVREDLSSYTPTQLVDNNDKRKELINRFDYSTKVTLKFITGDTINFTEFKEAYNSVEGSLSSGDLILFVDEKAMSSESKTNIEGLFTHISERIVASEIDIFYFANFMDNCQSTEDITQYSSLSQYQLYKSLAPNGIYCLGTTKTEWGSIITLMENRSEFYPTAKLSGLVKDGTLIAGTIWPRLFVPDITRATSNIENLYTDPCRYEPEYGKIYTNPEELTFYWFLIGMIIVIMIVWYISKDF